MERRRATRYELRIPLVFFWDYAERGTFQREGVTRDISETLSTSFPGTAPRCRARYGLRSCLPSPLSGAPRSKDRMRVLRVKSAPSKSGDFGFALTGKTFPLSSVDQEETR